MAIQGKNCAISQLSKKGILKYEDSDFMIINENKS